MTIGAIAALIMIIFLGGAITMMFFLASKSKGIIALIVTITIFFASLFGFLWYYKYTARGARVLKDQISNFNNGLNREITITAEDGREIYHYKGKCDIET